MTSRRGRLLLLRLELDQCGRGGRRRGWPRTRTCGGGGPWRGGLVLARLEKFSRGVGRCRGRGGRRREAPGGLGRRSAEEEEVVAGRLSWAEPLACLGAGPSETINKQNKAGEIKNKKTDKGRKPSPPRAAARRATTCCSYDRIQIVASFFFHSTGMFVLGDLVFRKIILDWIESNRCGFLPRTGCRRRRRRASRGWVHCGGLCTW